jgi:hypothetical protein
MSENLVGNALTQSQISRYNPETNHCYVKLEVSTADLSTPQEKFIRDEFLYDGQTKEVLAYAYWDGNRKSAMIFSDSLKKFVHDPTLPSYEETDDLIVDGKWWAIPYPLGQERGNECRAKLANLSVTNHTRRNFNHP